MRLPKDTDINISLTPDKAEKSSPEARRLLAKQLYELYEGKSVVNIARSFAFCKTCNRFSYYVENNESINLTKCQIIDERDGFDILIPVQLIHILSEHPEEPVDAQLFEHYKLVETM